MGQQSFSIRCVEKACRMTAHSARVIADRLEHSRTLMAFLALLVALGIVFLMQETFDGVSFLLTMWRRP